MKTKDRYTEMLEELFQQFRVQELNEKIELLNKYFGIQKDTNIVPLPQLIGHRDVDLSNVNKSDQKKSDRAYGEYKEIIRKTVKNMGIPTINKLNVKEALEKEGYKVRLETIAGTLKKWAKEKDPNGVRRTRRAKGSKATMYRNLGVD